MELDVFSFLTSCQYSYFAYSFESFNAICLRCLYTLCMIAKLTKRQIMCSVQCWNDDLFNQSVSQQKINLPQIEQAINCFLNKNPKCKNLSALYCVLTFFFFGFRLFFWTVLEIWKHPPRGLGNYFFAFSEFCSLNNHLYNEKIIIRLIDTKKKWVTACLLFFFLVYHYHSSISLLRQCKNKLFHLHYISCYWSIYISCSSVSSFSRIKVSKQQKCHVSFPPSVTSYWVIWHHRSCFLVLTKRQASCHRLLGADLERGTMSFDIIRGKNWFVLHVVAMDACHHCWCER